MDRRLFLTGLLGLAGVAAVGTAFKPISASAGVPDGRGILDELEASSPEAVEGADGDATVMNADYHRRHHRPRHHRPRRRHRRRVWRRYCRRVRHHGHWVTRCYRRAVWVWSWA